jgi:erythromycin esterase-like protein
LRQQLARMAKEAQPRLEHSVDDIVENSVMAQAADGAGLLRLVGPGRAWQSVYA